MRRILASALPPLALLLAFFAPLGGLGPWGRSALVLGAFAVAGALVAARGMRAPLLVALPGVLVGAFLTLMGAMEPAHILYGAGMAAAALVLCVGAAWSIAATRRQVG